MRVGIFSECYKPTINGVVVSIESFREELEKRGHKFFIFTSSTQDYREKDPSHVFRFPSVKTFTKDYPLAIPSFAPFKTDHILNMGLDLIHSQHMFSMGRLGLRIARKLNIPIVHTYHTLISEYTHYIPLFPGLAESSVTRISRNYCNACDQVITPSPSMKKILRSYGVSAPIESIPTGVNLEDFKNPYHKELLRSKWKIPEHQKILLYLSRVAREKNLDFLFSVVKKLAKKRNDFHLLLVGGGPELDHYQDFVHKADLDSRVTFTGMQEKKEANRFFGAADIFVFPSITETQGIVITEAMAAGTPSVAINKMGPSNIIKNEVNGFLTPLNKKEFSSKIEKLLDDDDLRKKMGKNAKESAEKFSTKHSADKMEDIYEKMLSYYSR